MLDDFQHRPRLDDLRLVERYIKAEFHIRIEFIWHSEPDRKFIAYFERAHVVSGPNEEGVFFERRSFFRGGVDHHHRDKINRPKTGPNSDQGSVFVDIVQAMEGPKCVSLPTFVWFERAECIDSLLPHALYFSAKETFVLRGFRCNEETGFFPVLGSPASCEVELLSKVVESRSQILDGVSEDDRNLHGDGLDSADIIRQSGLRIFLNSVWIGGVERSDCSPKITDVLVGPFNFVPDKREPFVGSHGSLRT